MASRTTVHETHHAVEEFPRGPREVTEELTGGVLRPPRQLLLISGAVFLVGIAGFLLRAVINGFDDRAAWGYYGAVTGFLLTTVMAAPLVAFAFRMTKANWRRPVTRAADLWAVTSLLGFVMLVPLLFLIPSNEGRFTVWFEWPWGAPHFWLLVGFAVFVVASLAHVWMPAVPDFAALRDRAPDRAVFRRLALGWTGTPQQWKVLQDGIIMTGAFFFMSLVFVHFLYPADFAIALVPGWKDAIFPAYHALSSLQGGLATTIVTLYVLRRWGGLRDYVWMEQFWALSKPLLAVSLLWFYFWWSGFIIYWYGRQPAEQGVLQLLMFDTYLWAFIGAFALCFIAPLVLLIWNPVRKSVLGPVVVSTIILTGLLIDRIRIYVSTFSVPDEEFGHHVLEHMPAPHFPDVIDLLIIVGAVGGAVFLYAAALRLLPKGNMWEFKEGLRLRVVRPYLRGVYAVIAKTR